MNPYKTVALCALTFVSLHTTPLQAEEEVSPRPMAIVNSVTVTMAMEGGKEEVYSVKNINDFDIRFPINDHEGRNILTANWEGNGLNGQPQLYICILNPNLPSDKNIFETRITLEKGKRQFVFSNPYYSLWIQVDEVKKEPIK